MAETDSRVKKSMLNARVNLIFYFIILVLSFFSRKIFLNTLGTDFVGFTGALQNLLGFLNLAELGIATAIGYVLYKPLFDHDRQKINEVVSVLGYLYRWIGIFILVAGVILSTFLPLIFPHTNFDFALIYFAYYSFLASTLIGYFINYRQNLLGADQRNYVVVGLYFYPNKVVDVAKNIKPSARDEYEITTVNQRFLEDGELKVQTLGRGFAWLDTGTHDSLSEASTYIEVLEKRQGLKVACLEGIAFRKGWITADKMRELAKPMLKNQYGKYLLQVVEEVERTGKANL